MNELEVTTFINTLSAAMAEQLDEKEIVIAAAFFTQIGDTLATIAALRA